MLTSAQSFGAHLGTIGSTQEEAGPNPWFVPTSFEVRADTQFGDTILVVGSTAALGNWNPTKAAHLPTWLHLRHHDAVPSAPVLVSGVFLRAASARQAAAT